MSETRTAAITLKGTPFDINGPQLTVGTMAPDFLLQNSGLEEVSLSWSSCGWDELQRKYLNPIVHLGMCSQLSQF